MTLDESTTDVPTPSNAVPDFDTSFGVKRVLTGTVRQACFDPFFSIFGVNPFGAFMPFPLALHNRMKIRAIVMPNTSVVGPIGIGDVVGAPITGAFGQMPIVMPADPVYIMLALRITKIHHEADAAAGQPFDFDFRTVWPFRMPGENLTLINFWGHGPGFYAAP